MLHSSIESDIHVRREFALEQGWTILSQNTCNSRLWSTKKYKEPRGS